MKCEPEPVRCDSIAELGSRDRHRSVLRFLASAKTPRCLLFLPRRETGTNTREFL